MPDAAGSTSTQTGTQTQPAGTAGSTQSTAAGTQQTQTTTQQTEQQKPSQKNVLGELDTTTAKGGTPTATETTTSTMKLTVPDGIKVEPERLKEIESFAKANSLSEAQAQKILDRDVEAQKASQAREIDEVVKIGNQWAAECEADAEIGGAKLAQTAEQSRRALIHYMTPDERKAFMASPLRNHPWILKFASRVGADLGERRTVQTDTQKPLPAPTSAAQDIYGPIFSQSR